jgi:two-component system chemotaxis sensor kinase CheA
MESADAALELCRAGEKFDIIVSDIEMPGMSGFDFAEHIKNETHWRTTPMVALSSYAKPRDLERGRRVGFSDYVSKTDREALLQTLSETLSETRGVA